MLNKTRNVNIELLRIFSMLLITLWHVKLHFINAMDIEPGIVSTFMDYIVVFISFHVNCFVIITGYFGVRDNTKGLMRTIFLIMFYSIILNLIFLCIGHPVSLASMFLPISHGTWWFMQIYLVLLLIAPLIEKYVAICTKQEYYILLCGSIIVNVYLGYFNHVDSLYHGGYDIINFVTVYLLGTWIRKQGTSILTIVKMPKTMLVLVALLFALVQYKIMGYDLPVDIYDYNSPYALAMAIVIFLLFLQIDIPKSMEKIIIFFSSSAVATYLVTDFPEVKVSLLQVFANITQDHCSSISGLIIILSCVLAAFCITCVIDKIRIYLSSCFFKSISKLQKYK